MVRQRPAELGGPGRSGKVAKTTSSKWALERYVLDLSVAPPIFPRGGKFSLRFRTSSAMLESEIRRVEVDNTIKQLKSGARAGRWPWAPLAGSRESRGIISTR